MLVEAGWSDSVIAEVAEGVVWCAALYKRLGDVAGNTTNATDRSER